MRVTTKGIIGNPSQRLRDMLKYIEESVDTNITNPDIEKLENYVKKVKSNKKVGINYMKSWEIEQMIKEEATKEGRAQGEIMKSISLIRKKYIKNISPEICSDMLEENIEFVRSIYDLLTEQPDINDESIYEQIH